MILGRDRMKDESLGYAKTFVRQMTESMALAKERGVRSSERRRARPRRTRRQAARDRQSQGLDIAIAHIEGDDLLARATSLVR